ncbi:hypothetical protein Cgig2_012472 [Carnegiea gigantea]|uniref:NPH3 domain-containing protein n=1 Tax=Carnegiea gigantea TaxID=171969 RepID=A0A9Q1KML6_9CARY|nr:hypothetical protein Cgig2_012472 [Carnegiea gigantea]
MKRITSSEPAVGKPPQPPVEYRLKEAGILDMDYFVKTLSDIKAKGVRPDLVGSIIAHHASKWVPELSESRDTTDFEGDSSTSPESATATWRKKQFFIETLVSVLPPEKDAIPCNFLLRLLRVANMVGVDPTYRDELEKRVSWQLDQASLKELMIPAFSHTCGTLLDVELIRRLVQRFMGLDESVKGGTALVKVAKLVDCYLAEAAVDSNLSLVEFIELAGALPPYARATDDGLYRAIDTYLKAHPGVSKQERKLLCRLIDTGKLSPEASLHASQNERLPVRTVIQVLFSEQNKLTRNLDWSGPLGRFRSPSPNPSGLELPARCLSKREVMAQQVEIKRLKEDVVRLQDQINALQGQLDRLVEKKKGFFWWRRFSLVSAFRGANESGRSEGIREKDFGAVGFGRQTPITVDHMKSNKLVKGKTTPVRWRKSLS